MAFQIPIYVPYPTEIAPIPSRETVIPPEGRQYAPLEFDWTGIGTCQLVDLGSRTTRPFSQIIMIDVDNSECSVDVEFMFPDSQTTITIPAGSGGRYPVTTSGIRFYAHAIQTPLSTDVTRAAVLNFLSFPNDAPRTEFMSAAITESLNLTNANTVQLIPVGTNGIVSAIQIFAWGQSGAVGSNSGITIIDGNGDKIAFSALVIEGNGTIMNTTLILDIDGIGVRFQNGLQAQITIFSLPSSAGGLINLYYMTAKGV